MSATLRYDIGNALAEAIVTIDPALLDAFGARTASRWGGVYRERKLCCTFAVKLPQQIEAAVRLLQVVDKCCLADSGMAKLSARALTKKLAASLGLPMPGEGTGRPEERAFLETVLANPADFATWLMYADWLDEQGGENAEQRARAIRLWNGPRAAKVKYGVIQTK